MSSSSGSGEVMFIRPWYICTGSEPAFRCARLCSPRGEIAEAVEQFAADIRALRDQELSRSFDLAVELEDLAGELRRRHKPGGTWLSRKIDLLTKVSRTIAPSSRYSHHPIPNYGFTACVPMTTRKWPETVPRVYLLAGRFRRSCRPREGVVRAPIPGSGGGLTGLYPGG
jgi:hypothetical protein